MDFMSTDFNLAKNTFCFHNPKTKKVAFVLNWDTRKKFYFNLLSNSFADVIDEPNDHSMVLTRPEEPNYFHQKIPAFDIKYIEDCFKIKDYPDPTKYLIKNTSQSNYTKDDIFDCWLYQKKKWSDLVSLPESKNNICKIKIEPSSTDSISQVTSSNDDGDYIVQSPDHSCMDPSSKNSNNDGDYIVESPDNSCMDPSSKNTRLPYTHEEDKNIVQYIIKNNYGLCIKGTAMWKCMEHDNVCKRRTWQSMKERYLKSIKIALNSKYHRFSFLTPEDLKILQQGFNNDVDYIVVSPDHSSVASSSKNSRLPYTHKEDTNIVQYIIKNNYGLCIKGNTMWQQMEHDNVCRRRTWQSMKERYLKPIKNALISGNHRFSYLTPEDLKILKQGFKDDVDFIVGSPDHSSMASSSKNTRLPYTHEEDTNIVQYIIKNNHGLCIKGRAMWQQMEHDNVCIRRTWQSMKERYLKSIKVALNSENHRFSFLTPEDLKILQQGLNNEQIDEKEEEASTSGFKKERFNYWLSDSS